VIDGRDRLVVFGGSGFIGSHVVARLNADGHRVVAPSRQEVDLLDQACLRGALREGDVVVNCAGYANATDLKQRGRAMFRRTNVEAVQSLAAAAAEARAAHLVHISSVAAMGRLEGMALSEASRGPVNGAYAASKRAAEEILARRWDDLSVTIVRPTSVFGEGRGLASALCRLSSFPVVPLPAGGRVLVPFAYVGNVAASICACVGDPRCFGGTYIVGDESAYRLADIVEGLGARLGRRPVVLPVPLSAARVAAVVSEATGASRARGVLLTRDRLWTLSHDAQYSTALFRATTGFVPDVSLEEALSRIAVWYSRTVRKSRLSP